MDAAETSQRAKSCLFILSHEMKTRRLWVEDHSDTENEGRDNLQGEWDSPGGLALTSAAIGADVVGGIESRFIRCASSVRDIGGATGAADVLGAVFEPVADEDTESNAHYNCFMFSKMLVSTWQVNYDLHCCSTTSVPRMPAVETSDMYMGTIIVSIPTARPAIARPIQIVTNLSSQRAK